MLEALSVAGTTSFAGLEYKFVLKQYKNKLILMVDLLKFFIICDYRILL